MSEGGISPVCVCVRAESTVGEREIENVFLQCACRIQKVCLQCVISYQVYLS